MYKKLLTFFLLFMQLSVRAQEEKVNLIDSSFESLRSGYVGVYNPEKQIVTCSKISHDRGPEEVVFSSVKSLDCCENCSGRIIGTYKNPKYDACVKACKEQGPPFYLLTVDQ